ncbi:hypothetical protein [Gorillibacterium sp. sgz5001074]|uniref:hypothetical protein n=1 Tax=Gorillibacterium sp. sgz5001074 TaxID=3446695 RepID=UPI003F6735C2
MAAGCEDDVKSLWNRFFVLRQQIETLKKENARLESEWLSRKDSIRSAPSPGVQEYKSLIMKKTKDAIILLNQQKEAELERIRGEFETRRAVQEERARLAEEEVGTYRQLLQVLLDEMEKVVLQMDRDEPEVLQPPEEKEPLLQPPAADGFIPASVPVQVVRDVPAAESAAALEPRPEPAGAGGAGPEVLRKTEAGRTFREPATEAAVSVLPAREVPAGGFWDDIDEYWAQAEQEESEAEPVLTVRQEEPEERLQVASLGNTKREGEASAEHPGEALGRGSKVVPFQTPLPERRREEARGGSGSAGSIGSIGGTGGAAITEEIELIKSQYIVGNLAGEELLDHRGHLIVKKNGEITPEVIARAEAEGRLAELIVHMILPGFEGLADE